MDSGNSGSLQSSSCGADEQDYDSRATAADDSMFMSTTSINTHPPPPQQLLFDPFSNYNNNMQQVLHHNNNNSSLSSSLVHPNYMENWPRPGTLRSDPNPHITNPTMLSNFQQRPTTAAAGEDMSGGVGPTRKKRSRASRRAPTTVLTTDTNNFRAMVQEFTGIPAPPFSTTNNSSRLDLFRSAVPPYLRRPFPHKPHHDSPLISSSTTSSTPPPMVNNYQQLPLVTSNNIVPPINNNPHLQTNPNTSFLFTNSLVTASRPHQFEILPSNYDLIGGALPSLISSDQISSAHGNHAGSGTNWAVSNNSNSDGVINGHDQAKHNGGDDRRGNIDNIIAMTNGGSSQGMVESWICSSD